MHIFWTARFYPPPYFKKKVSQFMAGMKRTVAKEMQERGVTCEEGKYPMGFLSSSAFYYWWQHQAQQSMCMQDDGSLLISAWLREYKIVSTPMWITCDGVMIPWSSSFINPRPTKMNWKRICHGISMPIQCYQSVAPSILWVCICLPTLVIIYFRTFPRTTPISALRLFIEEVYRG